MVEYLNVHEAKTQLSKLLARVESGERFVIARSGKPVADLVPHRSSAVRMGALEGRIWIADNAFAWPDPEIEAMFYGPHDPS